MPMASARPLTARRRAVGRLEPGAAVHGLAERAGDIDETLGRGAGIELHHQRQRHRDRDAVRNLEIPAAERHGQRVGQAEPRRIHRHAGHRARQHHRVARLAVASVPRPHGAGALPISSIAFKRQRRGDRLARLVRVALDRVRQRVHPGRCGQRGRKPDRELRIAQRHRRIHLHAADCDLQLPLVVGEHRPKLTSLPVPAVVGTATVGSGRFLTLCRPT